MKKIALFACAFALVLTSCSGDDSSSTSENATLVKRLDIDDENGTYSTNFFYNGTKLLRTVDTDGYHVEYTYTGDRITRIDYYTGEDVLEQRDNYTYDSSGRMTSYQMLNYDGAIGDRETFVYNNDGTVSTELYIGDLSSQTMLNNTGKIYFTNGEVTKIEKYDAGILMETNLYTYDTKKNPFMDIKGFNAISYTDSDAGGISHNVLTSDYNGDSYTYQITYNGNDYPTTAVERDGTNTIISTVDVIYQ